ncbi:MAG: hypothetical protein VX727_06970 [Planctomycetota bacterium]|nr:hypothetical protein [Planctomycetota bacterium]
MSDKRLFIEYRDGDEAEVDAAGNNIVEFDVNGRESRSILGDSLVGLPESKSVVVVQIANPYDRPLPLFGKSPVTGYISRNYPLYKVSLFGQQVVIDDSLFQMSESGYDADLLNNGFEYNEGTEPLNLEPNQIPGRIPRLPLFLPPATPEAPYTLVLFATGYDLTDPAERVEDARWIDFLDLNPEDNFYGTWGINDLIEPHQFALARDMDGNGFSEQTAIKEDEEIYQEEQDGLLRIYPGDLICRVPGGVWATQREHYDDADGQNAPGNGVAVELIRTHRRDYNGDTDYTDSFLVGLGQKCFEYQIDVVIDRTGIPSSTGGFGNNQQNRPFADEFFEVVTENLECERLPTLAEFTHPTETDKQMDGAVEVLSGDPIPEFEDEPLSEAVIKRLRQNSAEYGVVIEQLGSTGTRAFQFDVTVPAGVADPQWPGSSPDTVRWCQWARYTRAWGVDPGYPAVDVATELGQYSVPLSTSFLPSPINHMSRRSPRYIVGIGEVTRSKGRPVRGGPGAESFPLKPKSSLDLQSPFYTGMEQHAGDVEDRDETLLGQIVVVNRDARSDINGMSIKPRYMFESNVALSNSVDVKPAWGHVYDMASDPDGSFNELLDEDPLVPSDPDRHWIKSPWMTRNYRLPYAPGGALPTWYFASRKPTFFSMNRDLFQGHRPFTYTQSDGTDETYDYNFPDKGFYGYRGVQGFQELMPYGFQMLQKDANFEQVGEVLNVMLYGHELLYPAGPPTQATRITTTRTFSEAMASLLVTGEAGEGDTQQGGGGGGPIFGMVDSGRGGEAISAELVHLYPEGSSPMVGRLRMHAGQASSANDGAAGKPIGELEAAASTSRWMSDVGHVAPNLTPSQRVVELFVCDGPGIWDIYHAQQNAFGFSDGVIDTPQQASYWLGYDPSFGNAMDFDGHSTAGLININTAPIEVMQSLPHMYKLVHGTPDWDWMDGSILESTATSENAVFDPHPRVAIPEAISMYRNLQGPARQWPPTGHAIGPDYSARGVSDPNTSSEGMRGKRGFASIGELFNVNKPVVDISGEPFNFAAYEFAEDIGSNVATGSHDPAGHDIYSDAWTMGFAGNEPFTRTVRQRLRDKSGSYDEWYGAPLAFDRRAPNPAWKGYELQPWLAWSPTVPPTVFAPSMLSIGSALSTDVIGEPFAWRTSGNAGGWVESNPTGKAFDSAETYRGGDMVAGDAEEANLLFAGISNMITTRSDVFTVHFRIRTFVQNPETGVWDATDPDGILDDSRYVMLVDRSEVDTPDDAPRILYLQKVTN